MLFDLTESLRASLQAIRAHGFRSFLTTLGIVIGVAAVIAMVSLIQGLSHMVNQQLAGLGSNSILVQAFTPEKDRLQGKWALLTPDDLELIKARVDGIASITPMMQSNGGRSATAPGAAPHRFTAPPTLFRISSSTPLWHSPRRQGGKPRPHRGLAVRITR